VETLRALRPSLGDLDTDERNAGSINQAAATVMGAYNDLIIEEWCPACGKRATVRCQIHVGATYDGDSRGRFALNEYLLGQQLPWWPTSHRRFESWHEESDRTNAEGSVDECSYAGCESCRAELYVGVRFREHTPVEILSITLERPDWCIH
jgi:hypothetical protein